MWIVRGGASILVALMGVSHSEARQSDVTTVVEFQRTADTYAFERRQAARRGVTMAHRAEGEFFTPRAAALFRQRLQTAMARGCAVDRGDDFVVPAPGRAAPASRALPECLAAALPRLPPELEYRTAGVVLLLTDASTMVVVDVLHAAFPQQDN